MTWEDQWDSPEQLELAEIISDRMNNSEIYKTEKDRDMMFAFILAYFDKEEKIMLDYMKTHPKLKDNELVELAILHDHYKEGELNEDINMHDYYPYRK